MGGNDLARLKSAALAPTSLIQGGADFDTLDSEVVDPGARQLKGFDEAIPS